MIREAIDRIRDLGRYADGTFDVHGAPFAWQSGILTPVAPPSEHLPPALNVQTLRALVGYMNGIDGIDAAVHAIHVESPTSVALISAPTGPLRERFVRCRATWKIDAYPWGQFLDVESVIIMLTARFSDTGDRARALKLIGNLKDEAVKTHADDGVTQKVTARMGIATVEEVSIENPFQLAPMRSFTEIMQPESPFIVRVRRGHNGPEVALFEADGGAWRIQAVQQIETWFNASPDVASLVIA